VTASGRVPRREATYAFCASLFAVVLVITNVVGVKLFTAFGQTLSVGIITYPITFFLTDLVAEIWGQRRAQMMVIWGFLMSLVLLVLLQLAVALPPSPIWTQTAYEFATPDDTQRAYAATFANPGVLLFASMLAYLVAQTIDVRLYHFWWKVTGGGHMWIRNNASTGLSQLVDTIIVNSIFLHFGTGFGPENGFTPKVIATIIVTNYLFKVGMAALDTPLIYAGRVGLERFLGIEHDPKREHAPLADQ